MLLLLLGRQLIKYKYMRCTKKTLNFLHLTGTLLRMLAMNLRMRIM